MENTKVSIIIPAYNVERYLRGCLESLTEQSLQEMEIIIVNDGSTDGTQAIIDEFVLRFPKKIIALQQPNSGPAKARNLAMIHAKGEYIGFVDADDHAAFDMFERMYSEAALNRADLVLCGRAYTNEEGHVFSKWMPPIIDGVSNIFENHKLLPDSSSFLWDKLFRRELIVRHNFKFDEEIHYAEDALFVYSFLYYAHRVCSIQDALYFYVVQRPGSITGAMDSRMLHEIAACRELTKFYIRVGSFSQFRNDLLWIAIGFWGRKFYSFHEHKGNKKIYYQFVCEFYDFLEAYYSNWKDFLRKYATKGSKLKYKLNFYKTNKKLVRLHIYTPAFVVRVRRALHHHIGALVRNIKKANLKRIVKGIFKPVKKNEPMFAAYIRASKEKTVIDNRILYIPNSGDNLAGNPFYLMCDAARRENYEIFVGCKNPSKEKQILENCGIKAATLQMNSAYFQEVLATAKYIITNYRFPTYFCKRDGQVLLNTWHGTPLKYLGRHMNNGLKDLGNVQSQFIACDYLLYPNEYTEKRMVDAFMLGDIYTNTILTAGYPRNDIFYDFDSANRIREFLGLTEKKVFVYMPTWRGTSVSSTARGYNTSIQSMLEEIDSSLSDDVIVFAKLHNLAQKQISTSFKHIRQFPENLEIYQFLNIADGLITDYSSVFYDFANTKREIILFTYDEEEYAAERGMYRSLDTLPFVRIRTAEELAAYLNNWQGFEDTEAYRSFREEFCSLDSAKTSEKINNLLFRKTAQIKAGDTKNYTIVFTPDIYNPTFMHKCKEILNAEEEVLFVFDMKSITPAMTSVLRLHEFSALKFIVVQNEHILLTDEYTAIKENTDVKALPSFAIDALIREKNRMLPGIKVKKAINLTEDIVFDKLSALINNQMV